ncbi:NAD(P)-binding protein [Xylaria intraflava]|nr:NAD(P)-binding protein [Xylaria intraflava]
MYLTDQFTKYRPPKPTFTEKDLSSLHGKVYIVTGASSGIGKEVAQVLYSKGAKVYVATRSEEKAAAAIEEIKAADSSSESGELVFLHLDLADLTTIKASAEQFLQREEKLHVLFNNAGVMIPPRGSKTVQGYELQLGTNCLGSYLFTKFLTPILAKTAKNEPQATVRVIWVSSIAIEAPTALQGGIDLDNLDYHKQLPPYVTYAVSKAGNFFHATEYAKRFKADGIVSLPVNPGVVRSGLWRWQGRLEKFLFKLLLLHSTTRFGAYSELFAGLSPEITMDKTGHCIIPWGRFGGIRRDLAASAKSSTEPGGTGVAERFWEWTEEQVKPYL